MPNKPFSVKWKWLWLVVFLFTGHTASAHTINIAMERAAHSEAAWFYLVQGILHIIPLGLDHILFIVALCVVNQTLKSILLQATAFTLAHSLTLAISSKGIIDLPAEIVEPLIALSIAFVAVENIILNKVQKSRLLVVFLFGLIHGLGFAGALDEVGLPRNKFFASVLFFNLGVELAQIAIILAIYFLLVRPFGNRPWFRKAIVFPVSIIIGLVALFWTFERIG